MAGFSSVPLHFLFFKIPSKTTPLSSCGSLEDPLGETKIWLPRSSQSLWYQYFISIQFFADSIDFLNPLDSSRSFRANSWYVSLYALIFDYPIVILKPFDQSIRKSLVFAPGNSNSVPCQIQVFASLRNPAEIILSLSIQQRPPLRGDLWVLTYLRLNLWLFWGANNHLRNKRAGGIVTLQIPQKRILWVLKICDLENRYPRAGEEIEMLVTGNDWKSSWRELYYDIIQ
jgi:hypothetical protein